MKPYLIIRQWRIPFTSIVMFHTRFRASLEQAVDVIVWDARVQGGDQEIAVGLQAGVSFPIHDGVVQLANKKEVSK